MSQSCLFKFDSQEMPPDFSLFAEHRKGIGDNLSTHTTYIHRFPLDELALISLEYGLSESQILIIYLAPPEYNKYAIHTSKIYTTKRILSKNNS